MYNTGSNNFFLQLKKDNIINKKNHYLSLNLIEKYKYKWDYWYLSENTNLIEEFILKYPDQNWNIKYLIDNNKITDFKTLIKFKYINKKIINNYPNKLWDWKWLIENTNIYIEYYIPFNLIEKYSYKWNYYLLSYNPNITEEFILKYPYQNWNIKYLIDNNKITDFKSLSKFKEINQCIIQKYPYKLWDWMWLIKNTNVNIKKSLNKWDYFYLNKFNTEESILKYPYKNWNIKWLIDNNKITDFKALSKFKNINQYIIDNYPNKPWDWEWLIENTNIHIEKHISFNLIEKYKYKWDYWYLTKNTNITEEFILKYLYQNWNINYLIKNNKITDFNTLTKFKYINQDIIEKYPNKPWDWKWLIENTNIYIENI